jgi:hypothetical protein
MITEKEYINKEELVNVLKSILQFIVTNPETLINWDDMIKAATESASMEDEEEYEEGFDFEMSSPGGAAEEESGIEGEGGEEIEGTTEEGGGEEI